MKSRKTRAAAAILVVTVLTLATRVAWVASHLETGWANLRLQWHDATLGWFFREYESLNVRKPSDQAEFWLRETERIVGSNPQDAEIAMGAALVLHSPANGFMFRYVNISRAWPGGVIPCFDDEAIARATDQFHAKTDRRCLELAARATELEPSEARWWRLRALLQCGDHLLGDRPPRNTAWREVLDQCAKHDPDNALYDYLAASQLWNESAKIDWQGPKLEPSLQVEDQERFAQGISSFNRGLTKREFALCESDLFVMSKFLGRSKVFSREQAEITDSRETRLRMWQLLRGLQHWQQARANGQLTIGDTAEALALLRQSVRLYDQYRNSSPSAELDLMPPYVRVAIHAALQEMADTHPEAFSDGERDAIEVRDVSSRIDLKVLTAAYTAIPWQQTGQKSSASSILAIVWGATPPVAVLLFVAGGLGWLLARLLRKERPPGQPTLGLLRHVTAWLVGCGLTFVVLGMAPAEIISRQAQAWGAEVGFALGIIVLLVWRFRAHKFQFTLRTLSLLTLGVALLCSLIVSLEIRSSPPGWLSAQLYVPARGWEDIDSQVFETQVKPQYGVWWWALFQVWAYRGNYVSLVVSLLLVGIWHLIRSARVRSEDILGYQPSQSNARWKGTIGCMSRSALTVAVCCAVIYLAIAPYTLRRIDLDFQQMMLYSREPEEYCDTIRKEVTQIKADSFRMQYFRTQVEEELAEEAEREMTERIEEETDQAELESVDTLDR